MYSTTFLLMAIAAALLPALNEAKDGNYRDNCFDIEFIDARRNHTDSLRLSARCEELNPPLPAQPDVNCLDLNKCYGYVKGAIVPKINGNFGDSCGNCDNGIQGAAVNNDSSAVTCDCFDSSKDAWVRTQIQTSYVHFSCFES
ncbi:hypothetical protein AB5N19_01913 [Seiridium cardinale]